MPSIKNRFMGKIVKPVELTESDLNNREVNELAEKIYNEDFPKNFQITLTIDADNDVQKELTYELDNQTYFEDSFQLQVEYSLDLASTRLINKYEEEMTEKDEDFILDNKAPSTIEVVVEIGGKRHRVYGAKTAY